MRRDDLVCANCSRPVSEGRCAVCRATRAQLGHGLDTFTTALWALLAVLVALVFAFALQARFA